MNKNVETRAQDNFYEYVNKKWLDAPENQIPPEYPRWGGFIKLHDQSLKNQIELVKDLENMKVEELSDEQRKILAIWKASANRFQQWRDNVVDMDPIQTEFNVLNDHYRLTEEYSAIRNLQRISNMAKYLYYTQINGISSFINFDKGSDMLNSNNVVLDVAGSGLSLPSRDYYLDDNFAEKRALYRKHLENVVTILKESSISVESDFVDNVIWFETELAKIKMKQDQNRQYDEYYTNTTLDGFYTDLNDLKSLPDKQNNYKESARDFKLTETQLNDAKVFLTEVYRLFNFHEVLSTNYRKNFVDNNGNHLSKEMYHLTVYDGDYFRRLFNLIFDPNTYDKMISYHQYKIISGNQSFCSKRLNEEFFDFYSRKLNGQDEQKPDEKRSIQEVNDYTGEMLGKVYVAKYFPESSKQKVNVMINNILEVMKESIQTNDWLTQVTKEKALEKLEKFVTKIGYPDHWKDYSTLNLNVGDSLYNIDKKVKKWALQMEFYNKLNTVLDRTEWLMTPQTVNAYFMPPQNEIVFPGAILQPPFYHESIDTIDFNYSTEEQMVSEYNVNMDYTIPVNFGAIGAVIAHEITHGYDDNGRKYDKDGNLNDWWTEEDAKLFLQKTVSMNEQSVSYKFVHPETHEVYQMNGQLTMGENLADLGGLSLAKKGMFKLLMDKGLVNPSNNNYHMAKHVYLRLFFKSFANVWKQNTKNDFKIKQLTTDPHAPADFRANMVKNIDDFYEVFNVKPSDKMYLSPDKRVKMW